MIFFQHDAPDVARSELSFRHLFTMLLRSLALLAALSHAGTAMAELLPTSAKGRALYNQGRAFDNEGKVKEALDSYRAAAKEDPKASGPVSSIADLYRRLAINNTDKKEVEKLREHARNAGQVALELDPLDPIAMETLRLLADGLEQAKFQPSPEAKKAAYEGEVFFHDRNYDAAREKYELAAQLDPGYAEAVLFVGDCYFMQNDMVKAEQKFRQALKMNPLDGTGWRFLYDALIRQNKLAEAEVAALHAIAALPSAKPSWMRMAQIAEHSGRKLTPFVMAPRASYKDGTISYDPGKGTDGDGAVWLMYGMAQATEATKKKPAAPFAGQLAAWQSTLKVMEELGPAKVKDKGLQDMLRFQKGNQLQAAIFLLMYQEAYRPEFEAWKKAEPDAIKRFIDTFRVTL